MKIAEQVTFGGGGLDRAAELRNDAVAMERLLQDPSTRVLPLWRSKPLIQVGETFAVCGVSPEAELLEHASEAPVFLGLSDGAAWFAADISAWEPAGQDTETVGSFVDPTEQHYPGLPGDTRFCELRTVMSFLSPRDAELAATARGILFWQQNHQFCAKCGAHSDLASAGWQRDCPACGASHFPRTDPVVIMLITSGNSVLMGRSPGWPDKMFSLLAGFVEPAETVEAAVRREVFEEAGIRVGRVEYLASQPWPFPASLMIGCRGEALDQTIQIDPNEIEEAVWVTREEMLSVMAGEHPRIMAGREGAIARFILWNWLADQLD